MPIRSLHVFWPLALREGERLLDDLAESTAINTVELTSMNWDWAEGASSLPPFVSPFQPAKGQQLKIVGRTAFDSYRKFMGLAKDRGFSVTCQFTPLYANTDRLRSISCIEITGSRVPGPIRLPVSACPNNRNAVALGEESIRGVVDAWTSADSIAVNHVEFPVWPQRRLRELFACFCESCRNRAEQEGIDFDQMKREVRSLYDSLMLGSNSDRVAQHIGSNDVLNYVARKPYVALWLNFRLRSISDYVMAVVRAGREAAKDYGRSVRIGLEFQAPTLSNIVGTDFASLYRSFDWISPKFTEYVTGSVIPRLVEETTKSQAVEQIELMRAVRSLLGFGPGPKKYHRVQKPCEGLDYDNTFDFTMIENQLEHIRPLIGKVAIHPYTWLYSSDLKSLGRRLEQFRSNGLEGYMIWGWERNLTHEALKASKGFF